MDDEVLAGVAVDEPPDDDALLPSDEAPPEPEVVDEAPESPVDDDPVEEPLDDEPAVTAEPERESVR